MLGTRTKGSYSGDVGIVAIGETPYAEGKGDSSTLAVSGANAAQVTDICSRVTRMHRCPVLRPPADHQYAVESGERVRGSLAARHRRRRDYRCALRRLWLCGKAASDLAKCRDTGTDQ